MATNRRHLFGSVLALMLASAVGIAGGPQTPTPSPSDGAGDSAEGNASERFEGYVWLDVDGQILQHVG